MYSIIIALTGLGVSAAEAFALAALHPTRDNNYLTTLANAIVAGLPYGRTVADMAALADPAYNLSAADVVTLLKKPPTGLPAGFSSAHIVSLVGSIAGLNAHQMVQLVNCLHPSLNVTRTLDLLNPLQADGLDGLQIHSLIQRLSAAGLTGAQTELLIIGLRGHLEVAAPSDPLARFVTDIPAIAAPVPAPPYPPNLLPGQKVLSAPEIASHLTYTLAAGRAAAKIIESYPTGQDFTLRTDDQLWTDCSIDAMGHVDVNTLANETPDQKQIRQKLALGELIARHPARGEFIQRIFAHDEGQTARPFVSVVNEDSYSGGHIVDRHVMNGVGTIKNSTDLAHRVCTKNPSCGATASALNNLSQANSTIAAVLNHHFRNGACWILNRNRLTLGLGIPVYVQASVVGQCLRKTDPPPGVAYPSGYMGWGRPLIGPGVPFLGGLTHEVPVVNIIVLVRPSLHANAHGWAVYTAYPRNY